MKSKYDKENNYSENKENNDYFNEFIFHSTLSRNTFPQKINTETQPNHKDSGKILSNEKKTSLNEISPLNEISSDYLKSQNILIYLFYSNRNILVMRRRKYRSSSESSEGDSNK